MPQQIPKSQDNNYGGTVRHRPEHDPHLLKNFTDDIQDFQPNSAQYNDFEEGRSAAKRDPSALPQDDRDQPGEDVQPRLTAAGYQPSNYSEGGHGHPTPQKPTKENSDNKDYAMNKDFAQGAKAKYEDTEAKTRHHWWDVFRK